MSLFLVTSTVNAAVLPTEFFVNERFFSTTSTFDIESNQYKLGYVDRKFWTLRLQYNLYDIHDQLQARAKKRFFSFGAIFDVTDKEDQPIGIVEERVFRFFPEFTIVAPSGEILADAKMNFWGTKYTLTSPLFNEPIAILSRPFFKFFTTNWTVKILKPEAFENDKIHSYLFILVIAFQTDIDYWRNQADVNFTRAPAQLTQTTHIDLSDLRNLLGRYKEQLDPVEATEADAEQVALLAAQYLQNIEELAGLEQDIESKTASFYQGFHALLPLLEGDRLNVQQKNALYLMLETRIEDQRQSAPKS